MIGRLRADEGVRAVVSLIRHPLLSHQSQVTRWIVWLGYQGFVAVTIVPVLIAQSLGCGQADARATASAACEQAAWNWLLAACVLAALASALAMRGRRWRLAAVLAAAPLLPLALVFAGG